MRPWLEKLSQVRWLAATGATFAGLTFAFALWIEATGLHLIDETWRPEAVRDLVGDMTRAQRDAHWWMTLSLDGLYPFAYGAFLAGLSWRAFERLWLAWPAVVAVPFDLVEGAAQLAILGTGPASLGLDWAYAVKSIVTPIKLASFLSAVLIGLIAAGLLAWQYRQRRLDAM